MSWSVQLKKPVKKSEADLEIDALKTEYALPEEMADQLRSAKIMAKALLPSIPGPYVMVSLSGHANGIGYQEKPGWANDTITITVTQMTEENLKHFE